MFLIFLGVTKNLFFLDKNVMFLFFFLTIHCHNIFQWVWGLPFHYNKTYTEEEEIFSTEIMDIWTDFAKYG